MYKSKLLELCQKKAWALPEYTSTKQGLDHDPRFSATVTINGLAFNTVDHFKSSKLAQNDAARLAFDHFTVTTSPTLPIPSGFPQPQLIAGLPTGLSADRSYTHQAPPQGIGIVMNAGSQAIGNATGTGSLVSATGYSSERSGRTLVVEGDNRSRAIQHMHKNQLLNYAHKRNLILPVYSCEREGPPHLSRFKCIVTIDGMAYQGQEFLPTVKDAENAAAQVALTSLLPNGVQEDDSGLYKNLLQELLQKEFGHVPIYNTKMSGEIHKFVSTMEIEGESFTGQMARTKKLAEVSAAKVAYNTLRDRKSCQSHLLVTPSSKEQERFELLSSNAPSDIGADLQQHSSPNASKLVIPNSVPGELETEFGAVVGSHQSTVVSSEVGTCTVGAGSTSSGTVADRVLKTPRSASHASQTGSFSTFPPDYASDKEFTLEPPTKRATLSSNKVAVNPTTMNMTVAEDCAVLPISDENWLAISSIK